MREESVEAYLVRRAGQLGGMAIKLHPYTVGLPDRLVLLPSAPRRPAKAIFVELKRPKGGVVSRVQAAMHARLRRMGFTVMVLPSKEEINERFPK